MSENPPVIYPTAEIRKGDRRVLVRADQVHEYERQGWSTTGLGQPGIDLPADVTEIADGDAPEAPADVEDVQPRRRRRHE